MVTHFNRLQRRQGSTRAPLKDTWKVSLDGMQTEGAIYKRLHEASVSHIPLFLGNGDVPSRFCRIISHKFSTRFGLKIRPHSNYRLILLDDIGRDLASFKTTKELVETIAAGPGALQGKRNEISCSCPPLTPIFPLSSCQSF